VRTRLPAYSDAVLQACAANSWLQYPAAAWPFLQVCDASPVGGSSEPTASGVHFFGTS